MTDAEKVWNLRLGPLLLEAVPIEVINMIQEERLDPEEWTGEYVLRKLWESGLTWMTKYGLRKDLISRLTTAYMQYARNPGAVETVGILYWKLCWWRAAKKFLEGSQSLRMDRGANRILYIL